VQALDGTNPQLAARIVAPFTRWRRFDEERGALMKKELERLAAAAESKDVVEIVTKSLADPDE
jgi:aminopeptidase N